MPIEYREVYIGVNCDGGKCIFKVVFRIWLKIYTFMMLNIHRFDDIYGAHVFMTLHAWRWFLFALEGAAPARYD